MSNCVTPDKERSRLMARIRHSGTAPELLVRKMLWKQGLRYRKKSKLPGRPDLVFVGAKVAVFVDGCFWHGCPLHGSHPKTNAVFWARKLAENKKRDARVDGELQARGWRIFRIWEHEVKDSEQLARQIEDIAKLVLEKRKARGERG